MKNIYFLIVFIIVVICFMMFNSTQQKSNKITIVKNNKKSNNEKFQIYNRNCLDKMKDSCYNDPLTLAKCWATKDFPCPMNNGSYMQCTNNYKRDVNIADCLERTYYYSPKDERLSEKCVYKNVFPFAVKKDIPDNTQPSIFPRVNMWRNDDLPNGFFVAL